MKTLVRLVIVAVAAIGMNSAHAVIITIEPDNYAAGTDLTHLIPGVTISRLSQSVGPYYDPTVSNVVSQSCSPSSHYCPEEEGVVRFGGTAGVVEYMNCYSRGFGSGCNYGCGDCRDIACESRN